MSYRTFNDDGTAIDRSEVTHKSDPPMRGDRIELIEMGAEPDGRLDPYPILPGAKGTVTVYNELVLGHTQIGVSWDDGRTLSLVVPPDSYRIIERVMD